MTILETIEKQGYIKVTAETNYCEIKNLEKHGIIQTLASAQGFDMMNDTYIYVLKGNPRNIHWDGGERGYFNLVIGKGG